MSGIAGIFNRNGAPLEASQLSGMVAAMVRRGPDGQKIWHGGSVGLGHAALNATPESLCETQPLMDPATGNVITADIRLDNRDELVHLLRMTDRPMGLIGDAQLVLAAYEKWGEECVHHLLGDFAFAIWNPKEQTLFCARDHFGVRPLHYFYTANLFVFASDVQALLSLPCVPRVINEERIIDFLDFILEGYDHESTFFERIMRLAPGHNLQINSSRTKYSQYWRLDEGSELRLNSDAEYTEAFMEIFTESVRCRLRSIRPPASMLSGGMDSSSIVAVAAKLLAEMGQTKLFTFSTISKNNPNCLETNSIRAILAAIDVLPYSISCENVREVCGELDEAIRRSPYLFDFYTTLPRAMVSLARRHDVNVLLSGVLGDEVLSVSGIACISELMIKRHWRTAYSEIKTISSDPDELSAFGLFFQATKKAFIPHLIRSSLRGFRGKEIYKPVIEIPVHTARYELLEKRHAKMKEWLLPSRSPKQDQVNYLRHPWIAGALERYDRLAADQSVDVRHPLIDKRLVEFSISLPCNQKFTNNMTKQILRRSMNEWLPEAIVNRKTKEHLGWSLTVAWLRNEHKFVESVLSSNLSLLDKYMDVDKVSKSYRAYKMSTYDADESDIQTVWASVILAQWLRSHTSNSPDSYASSQVTTISL